MAAPASRGNVAVSRPRPLSSLGHDEKHWLCSAQSTAFLAYQFGSLAKAERLWRQHREALIADRIAWRGPPAAWWFFDSGQPELGDRTELDPRRPDYPDVLARFEAARAAVLLTHRDAWRWPP